jgi:2'-phosphotransferase
MKNFKDQQDQISKEKEMTPISKTMTWILRHKALSLGLTVDSSGWVSVENMLKLEQMKNIDVNMIRSIVESNDKKRFELSDNDGTLMIRASQGHSKELGSIIDDNNLLTEIIIPLEICVHGTTKKAWNLIKNEGLKIMDRTHIHFAVGEPGDKDVISGMRNDSTVLIYINMARAISDGIKFYKSMNNVILTSGIGGVLDPKYFDKVVMK